MIYRDGDESTKPEAGDIYTVILQTPSLTGRLWNVCLLEGRQGRIGFVCFWTVVLALVPPPTGIHCCLFGHQLRPLTFPNGWLIPLKATVEALVASPVMLPPSGSEGEL